MGWCLRGEKCRKECIVKKYSVIAMAILATVSIMGCAGMGGANDQELIQGVMDQWKAGMLAEDVDATLPLVADDFEHYEWGDKAGMAEFLQEAADMGYLEDGEVSFDDTEITIEGDVATVYPVDYSASFGSATIEFTLTKRDGGWIITGMDVEQY